MIEFSFGEIVISALVVFNIIISIYYGKKGNSEK